MHPLPLAFNSFTEDELRAIEKLALNELEF